MELQTNNTKSTGCKVKGVTILIGFSLILVPIAIGVLMTMPQVMIGLATAWKEIMKGIVIGLSILPVILFVTIKAGTLWYKKAWVWIIIIIAVGTVITIGLIGETSVGIETMSSVNTLNKDIFY